jgi:hypothetical protein
MIAWRIAHSRYFLLIGLLSYACRGVARFLLKKSSFKKMIGVLSISRIPGWELATFSRTAKCVRALLYVYMSALGCMCWSLNWTCARYIALLREHLTGNGEQVRAAAQDGACCLGKVTIKLAGCVFTSALG